MTTAHPDYRLEIASITKDKRSEAAILKGLEKHQQTFRRLSVCKTAQARLEKSIEASKAKIANYDRQLCKCYANNVISVASLAFSQDLEEA